jgi:hypothetical protein
LPLALKPGGDDAPLDYFLARQVLARLGETAEKGLLGSYKGAAGEWEKLVKAYKHSRERVPLLAGQKGWRAGRRAFRPCCCHTSTCAPQPGLRCTRWRHAHGANWRAACAPSYPN